MNKIHNIIQIKRGNGIPDDGVLLEGELGYSKDKEQLFIGKIINGILRTVPATSSIEVIEWEE